MRTHGGKFLLAKVNIDEHPGLATRYGVRGIPNVKAFVDGRVVDEFTGALPESGVRRFLEAVLPSPSEKLRQAARSAVARGEFEAAEAKLREAVALDADNHTARTDLAELLVARQDFAGADAALEAVPAHRRDERAEKLAARIGIWRRGQSLPDAATLKARVAAHPDDLDARLAYAERLVADGDYRAALEALLDVVRATAVANRASAPARRWWKCSGSPPTCPNWSTEYRRKLSSALY